MISVARTDESNVCAVPAYSLAAVSFLVCALPHVNAQGADSPAVNSESGVTGGEPDGIVQVANVVYAGTKSSRCFSDHFLIKAE